MSRRTTTIIRRRWAQRGCRIADFFFGFSIAGIEHVAGLAARVILAVARWPVEMIMRRRTHAAPARLSSHSGSPSMDHTGGTNGQPRAYAPIAERPTTRFIDIAGLDDAKREIMLRLVLPVRHPERARRFGIRTSGGLLLYGPPGTGKTMLARAVANELGFPLFSVQPADIMSGTVGEAEANVVRLFETVRRRAPSVLFLDEVESLVPSRRRNGSTIMQRVVSTFLSVTDGLLARADGVLLLAASNEPDRIDLAMRRPGRFDTLIYCGLPDVAARCEILMRNLADRPFSQDVSINDLALKADALSGAELRELVNKAADLAFLESVSSSGERPITADDFEVALSAIRRARQLVTPQVDS